MSYIAFHLIAAASRRLSNGISGLLGTTALGLVSTSITVGGGINVNVTGLSGTSDLGSVTLSGDQTVVVTLYAGQSWTAPTGVTSVDIELTGSDGWDSFWAYRKIYGAFISAASKYSLEHDFGTLTYTKLETAMQDFVDSSNLVSTGVRTINVPSYYTIDSKTISSEAVVFKSGGADTDVGDAVVSYPAATSYTVNGLVKLDPPTNGVWAPIGNIYTQNGEVSVSGNLSYSFAQGQGSYISKFYLFKNLYLKQNGVAVTFLGHTSSAVIASDSQTDATTDPTAVVIRHSTPVTHTSVSVTPSSTYSVTGGDPSLVYADYSGSVPFSLDVYDENGNPVAASDLYPGKVIVTYVIEGTL